MGTVGAVLIAALVALMVCGGLTLMLARHLPGTPAFLVNNRPIIGGQPFEYFKGVMDALLAGGA